MRQRAAPQGRRPHPPVPTTMLRHGGWEAASLTLLACQWALVLASAVAAGPTRRWADTVLVAGLAAGGPHGALDHLVPGWLDGSRRLAGRRWLLAYAAAATGALAALVAAPLPVLAGLVAVSVAHFALGEAAVLARRDRRDRDRLDLAAGWATASAMVALPVLAHPAPAAHLAALVAGRPIPLPGPLLRTALVAAGTAAAAEVVRRCARSGRRLGALELATATVAALVAPPAASFAVAFAAGHSLRHLVRLREVAERSQGAPGRRATGRRVGAAVVPLAVTAAVAAMAIGARVAPWPLVLVGGVLALAVPHAAVVGAIDRALGTAGAPRPRTPRSRALSS